MDELEEIIWQEKKQAIYEEELFELNDEIEQQSFDEFMYLDL